MLLKIYCLFDRAEREAQYIFTATTEDVMKRNVKGAMSQKEQNFFNTFITDKVIYLTGHFDTSTMITESIGQPELVVSLEEIRDELLSDIRRAKALQEAAKGEEKDVGSQIPGTQEN